MIIRGSSKTEPAVHGRVLRGNGRAWEIGEFWAGLGLTSHFCSILNTSAEQQCCEYELWMGQTWLESGTSELEAAA
jgi:hypothetical protein